MPKVIELTVIIEVEQVSCPGVWLCQDGPVVLTIQALDSCFRTKALQPTFPIQFQDVFYFSKRFMKTCAVNNICCLLKKETVYCELIQFTEACMSGRCIILARYLGSLNDILFPSPLCCAEGVDLLMRRSSNFPGILSPKIEVTTKVRIDEVESKESSMAALQVGSSCGCGGSERDERPKQRTVCHSPLYHRHNCAADLVRSRSRSQSGRSGRDRDRHKCNEQPRGKCRSRSCHSNRSSSRMPCKSSRQSNANMFNYCDNSGIEKQRFTPCATATSTAQCDPFDTEDDGDRSEDESVVDTARRETKEPQESKPTMNKNLFRTSVDCRFLNIEHTPRIHFNDRSKKSVKYSHSQCTCDICKRYHSQFC